MFGEHEKVCKAGKTIASVVYSIGYNKLWVNSLLLL